MAAIESLIALLSASPPSTVSETLALIESSTATLKASTPNSLSLTAGTDLFQRYILSTLQAGNTADFPAVRAHLLANSNAFVQQAKEARARIADIAKQFIQHESVIVTSGYSRVVSAVLQAASDDGTAFKVVQVQEADSVHNQATRNLVRQLRRKQVYVATVPFAALATAASKATIALVGAESLLENGGIISSMGTQQIGILAKHFGKRVYAVAESHKYVRKYPLASQDLGFGQDDVDFRIEHSQETTATSHVDDSEAVLPSLDYTPPDLITGLVTESGVHSPYAISEEMNKIWD